MAVTATTAVLFAKSHGKFMLSPSVMLSHIIQIQRQAPHLAPFLDDPKIVAGLSKGNYGENSLVVAVQALYTAKQKSNS